MPDSDFINRLIQIESGGNTRAVTGSYRGLGQFGRDLERRYGITDENWTDEGVQRRALGQHVTWLRGELTRRLGREPTQGEIYLAHQQGIAGGPALLGGGSRPAWEAIRQYYGSDDIAQRAIMGNIPSGHPLSTRDVRSITADEFSRLWTDRFGAPSTTAPSTSTATTTTPTAGAPMLDISSIVAGLFSGQRPPSTTPAPGQQQNPHEALAMQAMQTAGAPMQPLQWAPPLAPRQAVSTQQLQAGLQPMRIGW
jgi:hypothetical protein